VQTSCAGFYHVKSFKVLLNAESYTDAEASAFKYYEENLKEGLIEPSVPKIELYRHDFIVDNLESTDEVLLSKIYKLVVSVAYADRSKTENKVVMARGFDIERIIELVRVRAGDEYLADSLEVVAAMETNYFPLSPIFKKY